MSFPGAFVRLEYLAYCTKLAVEQPRQVTNAPRWKTVLNNERVRRSSQLLVTNQITPGQFLHQASFSIHAAVNHGLRLRNESDSEDSDSD